ncbi:MAG: DEAD/DEAH box helicase [Calditrichaeota bacterium]|nr:MAG: DEAD/DEAH box helicase [Calditrichota bacterium]
MNVCTSFAELGLSEGSLQALKRKGFEQPTPIQAKIIPLLMAEQQDLIGQAQTGTGKTAAFGLPILEKIEAGSGKVQAIVLTPTRELAIQVAEEMNSLRANRAVKIAPIYGGQSLNAQLNRLRRGVDVVVGTPGRVLDHLRRRSLDLSQVKFAVLDEADEMLNMGFIEDVQTILEHTNPQRTTLLFSATMPREIQAVARRYMKNHRKVAVEARQLTTALTDQMYFVVNERDKLDALCRIIDVEPDFYGLVFCRTKVDVDLTAAQLTDRGIAAEALHGDVSQAMREKILNKFKRRRLNVLVATDVAARGIDIQNLTHVINYAIPQNPESYVHRIGRTGRAGQAGTAVTFVTPEEYRKLMYIQRVSQAEIRREKLPRADQVIEIKKARIKGALLNMDQEEITDEYRELAREILAEEHPEGALAALLKLSFPNELEPEAYPEIVESKPHTSPSMRRFGKQGRRGRSGSYKTRSNGKRYGR